MNILKLTLLSSPRAQISFGSALVCAILLLFLPTGPVVWADMPAVVPAPAADPLAEALPILQAKYVDFQALNYKPGDKLSDLIARSGGKISLSAWETAAAPAPVITATLPDGVLYVRLASFPPTDALARMNWIGQIRQPGVCAYIIDLRSNTTPDDYAGAGGVIGVLGPDYNLFTSSATETIPLDAHPVTQMLPYPKIVLVNKQTTGAAEAMAGFLQADGALVVGQATAGKVAVFQESKLSSGQVLRYAVTATANDSPADRFRFRSEVPVWGRPVIPDISVTVDDRAEKAALALIGRNDILDVIQESPERHRLSEAALVQGQDPELDQYLSSLEKKPFLLSVPVVHDRVLISALDSLKAIRLSQRTLPAPATADASPSSSTSMQ